MIRDHPQPTFHRASQRCLRRRRRARHLVEADGRPAVALARLHHPLRQTGGASETRHDIDAVMIIRSAERPRRNPLLGLGLGLGLGLDELRRFAYTWHDCDDRLDLIRTALRTWAPDHAPHLREPLQNAQTKLRNWQAELPEPSSARTDEAFKFTPQVRPSA